MDVRNCRKCGSMFNYIGNPLCPNCMAAMEDIFQAVKEYIRDNPGASISHMAEATDVTTQQLRKWVREERLAFSDSSLVGLNCEKCGVMIKTGRFCEDCKRSLGNDFASMIRPEVKENPFASKKRESARMHFLDK